MMYVIMPSTSLSSKVSMEVVSMMRASIIAGRMLYLFCFIFIVFIIQRKNTKQIHNYRKTNSSAMSAIQSGMRVS